MDTKIIDSFSGQYRWLSNFWPVKILHQKILFPSVEHAYQAAKTENQFSQFEISNLASAGQAKKYWKEHPLIDPTPLWETAQLQCMESFIHQKFWFNNEIMLVRLLIETGDAEIIEGNTWGDTFWGQEKKRGKFWIGKNHLGNILMKQRKKLLERKEMLTNFLNVNSGVNLHDTAAALEMFPRDVYLQKMAFGIK